MPPAPPPPAGATGAGAGGASRASARALFGEGRCSCVHCAAANSKKRCLRLLAAEGSLACEFCVAGALAVGFVVEVLWPRDACWYRATCAAYDAATHQHTLVYAIDGDVERRRLLKDQLRWPCDEHGPQVAIPHTSLPNTGGPFPDAWAGVRAGIRAGRDARSAQLDDLPAAAVPTRGWEAEDWASAGAGMMPAAAQGHTSRPAPLHRPAPAAPTGSRLHAKPPAALLPAQHASLVVARDAVNLAAAACGMEPAAVLEYWNKVRRFFARRSSRHDMDRNISHLLAGRSAFEHAHTEWMGEATSSEAHKTAALNLLTESARAPLPLPDLGDEAVAAAALARAAARRLRAETEARAAVAEEAALMAAIAARRAVPTAPPVAVEPVSADVAALMAPEEDFIMLD